VARLGLLDGLRYVIDHELAGDFDGVTWQIEPEAESRTQTLSALTTEVLFYAAREAIRNAARHGRHEPAQPLHLRLELAWHDGLLLLIEDDGVGLSTAGQANGGSGQGLALHSTLLAVIGGSLVVDSTPGAFTRVRLALPDGAWPMQGSRVTG
jgi:signal transduction histidine kinase